MSSPAPKSIEIANDIEDRLNKSVLKGEALSKFEFKLLLKKAEDMEFPLRYACLSAIYSCYQDYVKSTENAKYGIKYGINDDECVTNSVLALHNAFLFEEIVELVNEYPSIIQFSEAGLLCYNAAINVLDLDLCEKIAQRVKIGEFTRHLVIKNFIGHDNELIKHASEYVRYAVDSARKIMQESRALPKSFFLNINTVNEDYQNFDAIINFKNVNIDKIIEMEDKWHDYLAKYNLTDYQLYDFPCIMDSEAEEDNS